MAVLHFLTHLQPFDSPFLLLFFLSKTTPTPQPRDIAPAPAVKPMPCISGVTRRTWGHPTGFLVHSGTVGDSPNVVSDSIHGKKQTKIRFRTHPLLLYFQRSEFETSQYRSPFSYNIRDQRSETHIISRIKRVSQCELRDSNRPVC
jgi:hypothetical protein